MDGTMLEPLLAYNSQYKDLHAKNTVDYFDNMAKSAKTDIEGNRTTVKEYKKTLKEIDEVKKKISSQKGLRTFLIVVIVLAALAGVILGYLSFGPQSLPLYAGILGIIFGLLILVGGIVLIVVVINKRIKNQNAIKASLEAKAAELLNTAWSQMATLNSLFDWGMQNKIITKTIPTIEMDQNLDPKKFQYMHEKYGLQENLSENTSLCMVQSGSIYGNPFLIYKEFVQSWYQKTYTGSLTIHWTTTVRTSSGVSTVNHTQTLYASLVKPCPGYEYQTRLLYANDAAPNLSFSRGPSGINGLSDKQIEKKIASGKKELIKKERKAVTKQQSYTKLGNDEFEVLFGGEDRDNEVEFRLLYTPLAQKNIVTLLKSKKPFGDDFGMEKRKQINLIASAHSQNIDYSGNPALFVNYDYDECRKDFIEYNQKYFEGFFFDLAPLISVPLYQQHKAREYIYKDVYPYNVTGFEHEVLANSFPAELLKHPESATPSIMKTYVTGKAGEADNVMISAHGFRAVKHVTYISKFGRDGRFHNVPVYWIEYVPVVQETPMAIEPKNSTRFDYNNQNKSDGFAEAIKDFVKGGYHRYQNGLFAALLLRELTEKDVAGLNKAYVGNPEEPVTAILKQKTEDLVKKIIAEQEDLVNIAEGNVGKSTEDILNDKSMESTEVQATEEEIKASEENDKNDGEEGSKEEDTSAEESQEESNEE